MPASDTVSHPPSLTFVFHYTISPRLWQQFELGFSLSQGLRSHTASISIADLHRPNKFVSKYRHPSKPKKSQSFIHPFPDLIGLTHPILGYSSSNRNHVACFSEVAGK